MQCINRGVFPNVSSNRLSGWWCCFCLSIPSIHMLTSFQRVYSGWTQLHNSSHLHTLKLLRQSFRMLHDQIYIIMYKSSLFSCVWLSRLCTFSFSSHLHVAMCLSQFLFRPKNNLYCMVLVYVVFPFYIRLLSEPPTCSCSPQRKKRAQTCRFFILTSATA